MKKFLAKQIADHIGQAIRTQYTSGNVLRDAHPKAHGCVRAEFHVSKSLPKNLAKGILFLIKPIPHGFVSLMLQEMQLMLR